MTIIHIKPTIKFIPPMTLEEFKFSWRINNTHHVAPVWSEAQIVSMYHHIMDFLKRESLDGQWRFDKDQLTEDYLPFPSIEKAAEYYEVTVEKLSTQSVIVCNFETEEVLVNY
tara:strand:+ start:145 stop:483 length:339 start_codon:yes stop_codon:yes gene_type:complete